MIKPRNRKKQTIQSQQYSDDQSYSPAKPNENNRLFGSSPRSPHVASGVQAQNGFANLRSKRDGGTGNAARRGGAQNGANASKMNQTSQQNGKKSSEIPNPNMKSKKSTPGKMKKEKYQIFQDIANHQDPRPTDVEIPDLQKFIYMKNKEQIQYLEQVIDNVNIRSNMQTQESYVSEAGASNGEHTPLGSNQTQMLRLHSYDEMHSGNKSSVINYSRKDYNFTDATDFINKGSMDVQQLLKDRQDSLKRKFFPSNKYLDQRFSSFDQIPDGQNGKSALSQGGSGDQATLEVIKFHDQYYFINRQFVLNPDKETGKLAFQVVQYKTNPDDGPQIDQHDVIYINNQVQLKTANSALVSIVQNGQDLYYFKIAKENTVDIFNMCSYDIVNKKETVALSQKLNAKFDSNDEEMEAVSLFICKTDDFYCEQQNHDDEIDYLRNSEPYLTMIVYKSSSNQMVLSIRKLMDIQNVELYQIPLDVYGLDWSRKINQPYIITKECINNNNPGFNVKSDLLVISYQDKDEDKMKVLSVNKVYSPQQIILNSEGTQQQEYNHLNAFELKISDDNYPTSMSEIRDAQEAAKKQSLQKQEIAQSLLQYFKGLGDDNHFSYYIASTDEHNRKFMTSQNNQSVKANMEKIVTDILSVSGINSKMVVVSDYVLKKILVIYSCQANKAFKDKFGDKFVVFEFDFILDSLRYSEKPVYYDEDDGASEFSKNVGELSQGPKAYVSQIQKLFESNEEFDPHSFMFSKKVRNIIRDNKQFICFLDVQVDLENENCQQQALKTPKNGSQFSPTVHENEKSSGSQSSSSISTESQEIPYIIMIADVNQESSEGIGPFSYISPEHQVCWDRQIGKVSNQISDKLLGQRTIFLQSCKSKEPHFFRIEKDGLVTKPCIQMTPTQKSVDSDKVTHLMCDYQPFVISTDTNNSKSSEKAENSPAHEMTHKFVSESLIFKEDDREERPFIVIQLKDREILGFWIVLINIRNNQIIDQQQINICRDELDYLDDYNDICFCASESIKFGQKSCKVNEKEISFRQRYQICICLKKLNQFKILEFQVDWSRPANSVMRSFSDSNENGSYYNLEINQIGQKQLIQKSCQFSKCIVVKSFFMVPLLDENFEILGTQVYMTFQNHEKKVFNLQNLTNKKGDYQFKNKMVKSGYKIYNKGLCYEFILVEAKLRSQLRHQCDFFNNFEKESILAEQIRILLNMVPNDIVDYIERLHVDGNEDQMYDRFQCLQMLKGQSIVDFNITNTTLIEKYIQEGNQQGGCSQIASKVINFTENKNAYRQQHSRMILGFFTKTNQNNAYISILEQLIQEDLTPDRKKQFERIGLLREVNEISNDVWQVSSVERCFMEDENQLLTAELMLNFMFHQTKFKPNLHYQKVMMQMLHYFIYELHTKFGPFYKFIENKALDQPNHLHLQTEIIDEHLPKFSNKKSNVRLDCSLQNVPCGEVKGIITKQILQDYNNQVISHRFKIQHSYIDMRHHILKKKLNEYLKTRVDLKQVKLPKVRYTEYNIANEICMIYEQSEDGIQKMQILQLIIDYQFQETFEFVKMQILIYICGYFVPLVCQMQTNNPDYVFYCNISCLCTTVMLFGIEIIQMHHQKFSNYIADWWNINDIIMNVLFWNYCYIRLFSKNYRGNFLLVKEVEFEDSHKEVEQILKMLQNFNNTGYVDNYAQNYDKKCLANDYNNVDPIELSIMSMLNFIVIMQAFIKLLFYFTVFERFGLLIELVLRCAVAVSNSIFFFIGLIFLFSLIFQVIGLEIFSDDYFGMTGSVTYALYSYRNAIGDLSAPVYTFWLAVADKHPISGWCMISLIWIFWILNQWIVLIIVFNLLIAIIGETYGDVMSNQLIHWYQQSSQMNRETRLIFRARGILGNTDCFILSSSSEYSNEEHSEWNQFTQQIKGFIKQHTGDLRSEMKQEKEKQMIVQSKIEASKIMADDLAGKISQIEKQISQSFDRTVERTVQKVIEQAIERKILLQGESKL